MENAALEPDKAERRHLSDELRVRGRGGIIAVSISIAAAGEQAITSVLRQIASAPADEGCATGQVYTEIGVARWEVCTVAHRVQVLTVWLGGDVLP